MHVIAQKKERCKPLKNHLLQTLSSYGNSNFDTCFKIWEIIMLGYPLKI